MTMGMIQPEVRRVASITRKTSATPITMSQVPGLVLRSVKSSPPRTMYAMTATDSRASTTSNHMSRCRNRRATGIIMKVRNRMRPTCRPRSRSVRTMP